MTILSSDELTFYRRQIVLDGVGASGQAKLKASRALVVGAGGLGCPALQYLAASGVGSITICDGDPVEISNLHRQTLFAYADAGRPKAVVASARLQALNPYIRVEAIREMVTPANIEAFLRGQDVVLDCTDNFAAKFLIHDACWLAGVPIVQASIYRMDGQLNVFRRSAGVGCLRCIFPDQPDEACTGSCAQVGVLGAVAGVFGSLQAAAALQVLLGQDVMHERSTFLLDLQGGQASVIGRSRDPSCPLCGVAPTIRSIDHARYLVEPAWVLDRDSLSPDALAAYTVIDVRSPAEHEAGPPQARALMNLPSTDIDSLAQLPVYQPYLLVCARGLRSRSAAAELRRRGRNDFFSLRQGVENL